MRNYDPRNSNPFGYSNAEFDMVEIKNERDANRALAREALAKRITNHLLDTIKTITDTRGV